MKKLILFIILFPMFLFAQTNPREMGTQNYNANRVLGTVGDSGMEALRTTQVGNFTISQTNLTAASPTAIFSLRYNNQFVYITVQDTGTAYTDSLIVYVGSYDIGAEETSYDTLWAPVDCISVYDRGYISELIPGTGNTRKYLVNEPFPDFVKVTRTNTVDNGTTKIKVEGK